MKSCSLNDFMEELSPWLDKNYINEAFINNKGHFVLKFTDGMKNFYRIDDCNKAQIRAVLKDLEKKGIPVS